MSYLEAGLSQCKQLQDNLENHWASPFQRPEPTPLMEFLMQQSNPLQPVLSPGNGKIRALESVWTPRALESEVTEASERICTATSKPIENVFTYEIDPNDLLQAEFTFEADDFTTHCGSNQGVYVRELANKIDAISRKAATRIAGEVALMAGKYVADVSVDGNDAFVVATKADAAGINPAINTLQKLDFALRMQTGHINPLIVANDELYQYIELMRSGCCYNGGVDLGDIFSRFGMAATYDRRLTAALTASAVGADALAIDAGSIQLVNYVQAPWKDGMPDLDPRVIGGTGWAFVVQAPNGLLVEVRVSYKCGKVQVVLDTVITARALPNNLTKEGDYYEGVNWINKIKVTNPS
jgi:hypothetical protein